MESSDKEGIRILTELLVRKGVKRVVLSPGSRNAPLIVAFAREKAIEHFVVLDERSAAFFALGMAQQSGEPVALACTSGTALLNYAPAIAEAYYQRIPLVVISADRPEEWIDQDDSQTIRQKGALDQIVKKSYQLPVEIQSGEERWYVNRTVNEALNYAQSGRKGPIHINIPLHEPLYGVQKYLPADEQRCIGFVDTAQQLSKGVLATFQQHFLESRKVLVLAGFYAPDPELSEALDKLSAMDNVVVLTESLSNLCQKNYISTIDRVLACIDEEEQAEFAPHLLITFGGPLVSKIVKTFLRNNPPRRHWSLDKSEHPADTFKFLTNHINLEAKDFFNQFIQELCPPSSDYAERWKAKSQLAAVRHEEYVNEAVWSDLKAFSYIIPSLPPGCRLQLSNSTPTRYAQLFKYSQVARTDGNRGTSGIEGATSTAVGASWVNPGMTVFITGDMSFLYDSNALWNRYITPSLRIIVMKNGGGGIFRFIPGPSGLQELDEFFETAQEVDVEGFAILHNFRFYRAADEGQLKGILPLFFQPGDRPVILEVETPRLKNDVVLKSYFKYLKA